MVDIIKYISAIGWVMKFLPRQDFICIDFFVVEKGIEFRESLQCDTDVTDEVLNFHIWHSIERLEKNIKQKLG